MAVTVETPIFSAVANGVTTVFPYSFTVQQAGDLVVSGNNAGAPIAYTYGFDYTLTGLGTPTGSVVFTVAPAAGIIITGLRDTELQRSTDYQDNGDLLADTVNGDFDRLWQVLQEMAVGTHTALNALRVAPGETLTEIASAAARASKMLGFDASGNPTVLVPASGTAADVLTQLANSAIVGQGDALVAIKRILTGTVAQTLHGYIEHQLPTPQDFGAVGDGVTIDDVAFAAWALAIAGKGGRIPDPLVSYKLTAGVLLAANTTVLGDGKYSTIIDWYGAGPVFRCVGTVNVGGSNKQLWKGYTIRMKGNASPQDGMALLWGGLNVVQNVRITWDGVNRPRHCIIADQLALLQIHRCDLEQFTGAGVLGPNTGEYTTFGVSTSSFLTAVFITGCQVNSQQAGCAGVAIDQGEVVLIDGGNNFNAIPTPIRLGNVTAWRVSGGYFERTVVDYNAATNRGPAVNCADTSFLVGAALVVTNRTLGVWGPANHAEMYQRSIGDVGGADDGIVELHGFAGTILVTANQFAQPRSHCVLVASGAVARVVFEASNYHLNAAMRDGKTMDVFVAFGATANIVRTDARRAQWPAAILSMEWGGHKLFFAATVPTSSAGSALEGETVAPGDLIMLTDGSGVLQVQTGGTFGDDQASTCSTTNGSRDVVLAGSNGTILEGGQINIAGVTGTKTVRQVFASSVDGLQHLTLDTAADSTGGGRAITYAAPVFGPEQPSKVVTSAPGSGAAVTIDSLAGREFIVTQAFGAGFAINAPANPVTGRQISVVLKNTSGGVLGAIAPNAVYKLVGGAWPVPTNGNNIALLLRYDGTNWCERARSGTVPN